MSTITGYEVRAGVVRMRTMYATREAAAKHVKDSMPSDTIEGFKLSWGEIVPTVSRMVRGKWRHQTAGKSGRHWDDYAPPYTTRAEAQAARLQDLRETLKRRQRDARNARAELAKARAEK